MKKWYLILAAAAAVVAAKEALELPASKITMRVIDESGTPVANAKVTLGFDEPKPEWGGGKMVNVEGSTDDRGQFSGEGHSLDRVGGRIEKGGYYFSSPESFKFNTVINGKWQPWNPTLDVVLKKIVRPVPMYARFKFETDLPTDAPVGFDLVESDWVDPYGHGKRGDLILKVTKRVASFHDFGAELLLSFPNNGDGIQETIDTSNGASRLRSPQQAPDTGYGPTLSLLQGNSKERGEYGVKAQRKNYAFRVRTVLDERGQVVSANYGKIYDTIEYFPVESRTAKLRFTYYFNPTPNDRGLEFDPKQNLFSNLKDLEKPAAP
jgi:hypothetical protein